jgi:quercetin dioxygenase-like cupin family protein
LGACSHLAIHRVVAVAGAHGRARQLENQERVLYVLEGAVEGQADQRAFEASAGSLVFVPEGPSGSGDPAGRARRSS